MKVLQNFPKPRLFLWFLLMFFSLMGGCQDPPLSSVQKAEKALKQAREAGAKKFAEDNYIQAEKIFQAGQMEMARQNGRLAPLRDYTKADSLLLLAYSTAQKASSTAKTRFHKLKTETQNQKKSFQNELTSWREALNGTLTLYKAERHWSAAKMNLEICERLFAAGEYEEMVKEVARGKKNLVALAAVVEENAGDESQKIKTWRRWVETTVAQSRETRSIAVIVDKTKHKLYLLSAGKIIHTYDCDLGYNSVHQKMVSGDGATPEGVYQVSNVKAKGSKYYKALLLDYPNDNDKKRFAANKKHGIISKGARIGGLIEIHGEGGRNKDWTEGCVALSNPDMDELMKYVKQGTTVTIVRKSDQWP